MTQDEIIKMLRASCELTGEPYDGQFWTLTTAEIESFAKLVADVATAKERERIIKLLKGIDETEIENTEHGWWETSGGADFGETILKQIKGEA